MPTPTDSATAPDLREVPAGRDYRYPRLVGQVPVLTRGSSEAQIGFDQEPSMVLSDVHPDLVRVLKLLDGRHPMGLIRGEANRLGVRDGELDWCLRTLHQGGLLADGPARPEARGFRLRLIGAGRLGRSVAALICPSGVSVLHVIDPSPPDVGLYPAAGALGSQAEALVSSLETAGGTRVHVALHWSKPDHLAPDLTIVASEEMENDRVVADGLVRADQPHLLLRSRSQGVVVGPLVVPGQTACLRCTDLARRDLDPAWPGLLRQLSRLRAPVPDAVAGWAAGVAAVQALAFLRGSTPETYGATLELSTEDYLMRWRAWRMRRDCGCAWGASPGWSG